MMVLEGVACESWSDHEEENLVIGISDLIKEAPQSPPSPFHHVKTRQEVCSLQTRRGSLPEPKHSDTLILVCEK